MKNKKKLLISFIILVILSVVLFSATEYIKTIKKYKNIYAILNDINIKRESIYDDFDNKEAMYKKLLEEESDTFKIAEYSSMLVKINAVKGNKEELYKYGELAIKNYSNIDGGEILVTSEKKFLAWALFKIGQYSEALEVAYNLIDMLDSKEGKYLSEEERYDTKVLVYTILINIYTEYELPEEAKEYYDKLLEIEITEELNNSMGEKIAFSKMAYAIGIEDYELMKKYADECYEVMKEKDERSNTNRAGSMLINCAIANIEVGNYEEALEQIEQVEKYIDEINDNSLIALVSYSYGKYYWKIGNIDKAIEYLGNTINLYKELGDINNLYEVLEEYVELCNKNNITDNIDENYRMLYELNEVKNKENGFKELLVNSLDYNDNFNKKELMQKEEAEELIHRKNTTIIVITLSLLISSIIMFGLLKYKKKTESELEEIAYKDYLTKANTRLHGYKLIEDLIESEEKFSLGILDIDKFKNINDTYGHDAGDNVLSEFSKTLINSIEKNDFVIRYGGEEFIVVFLNKTKEESKKILLNIQEKVKMIQVGNDIIVTFSAGIAECDGKDIDEAIEHIDKLLYKAKNNGRNRVEI